MEFVIGIGIGMVIALVTRNRKKREAPSKSGLIDDAEHQRRQKADEELITVILPTINNGK